MSEGENGRVPAVAVYGADGFIGGYLLRRFSRANASTVGFARRGAEGLFECDLLHPEAHLCELKRRRIALAVIASAITSVAECETDPVTSKKINVNGTLELARQLHGEGIKVLFPSSDYVFDGTRGDYDEQSPVNPLNEYGRQKAEVERRLFELCGGDHLVVRLSKVFDGEKGGGKLLDEMAGRIARGLPVRAAGDQVFCPTDIDDVGTAIERLGFSGATGLFHVCSREKWSRYAIARRIAQSLGVPDNLIQEISLDDLGEGFRRPRDTSMVCARLGKEFSFRFRSLQAAIDGICAMYMGQRHEKTN